LIHHEQFSFYGEHGKNGTSVWACTLAMLHSVNCNSSHTGQEERPENRKPLMLHAYTWHKKIVTTRVQRYYRKVSISEGRAVL
jgi:hypothetical protein